MPRRSSTDANTAAAQLAGSATASRALQSPAERQAAGEPHLVRARLARERQLRRLIGLVARRLVHGRGARVAGRDRRHHVHTARVRRQRQPRGIADALAGQKLGLDEVVRERQRRDLGAVAPGQVLPGPRGSAALAGERALVADDASLDAPHARGEQPFGHRLERGRGSSRREARREVGVAAAHQVEVAQDAAEAVQAPRRLERGARARVRPERFERRRRRDELERRSRAERLPGILRVERLPAREAPHLDPPERGLEPGTSDGRLDRLA